MRLDLVPVEGESIYPRSKRADYAIDPETGCWNWLKATSKLGYPSHRQHRRYYELAYGIDITGLHVHHKCKNTSCVNPAHLEAIDRREHHAHHFLGERAGGGGLTIEDVKEIRRLGTIHGVRHTDVMERYGISANCVYEHWLGERWAEVGGESKPPPWACANEGCTNGVTGHRHKRYCSKRCRRAAGERRRRAGIYSPGGSNGVFFDARTAPLLEERP